VCSVYKAAVVNLVSIFSRFFSPSLFQYFSLYNRAQRFFFVTYRRQENLLVGVTVVAGSVIFLSQNKKKKNASIKK
jgi:hypothetical protein